MARSEDTKTNMAARLRALATHLEIEATDEATVKMIFDLKGAASHLDDLDDLLDAILTGSATELMVTIPRQATEIRKRKAAGSDPEPRMG